MSRTNDPVRTERREKQGVSPYSPIMQWFSRWKSAGRSNSGRPLTREQIAALLPRVPDWRVVERNGITRLERIFVFPDLAGALAFAIQVGAVVGSDGHQPAMLVEHDQVRVSWWTLSRGGPLRDDFERAAQTDALYQSG